jgi:hypothetical protein
LDILVLVFFRVSIKLCVLRDFCGVDSESIFRSIHDFADVWYLEAVFQNAWEKLHLSSMVTILHFSLVKVFHVIFYEKFEGIAGP